MKAKRLAIAVAAASSLLLFPNAASVLARGTTSVTAERGQYLANAGACAACHTAEGGKPYAGGRAIATPFGTIYSTNLTPDRETGIGRWSNKEFYKAVHAGVRRDGKRLYPAFPYPWYTKVSVDDVRAIKAYLDTLPAVKQKDRPSELPWPLSIREVMAGWNALYFHEGTFRTEPNKPAQWNRGAYLVEGLAHCGACHTPKNKLGAPKKDDRLEGGYDEHWYASNLTGDLRDGLGAWSAQEIVEYLKTGSNAKAVAAGSMAEVVRNSTQYLSDADLNAMAIYLKDLPATQNGGEANANTIDQSVLIRGKALYIGNCAGCHLASGAGIAQVYPPLKASALVQAKEAASVMQVLVGGATKASTKEKPIARTMPAFGPKLSDQEIADVATYIRNTWGNRAGAVSAGEAAKIREEVRLSAAK